MKLQKDILKAIEKHETSINIKPVNYHITKGYNDYFNIGVTDGHFIKFYNDKHFFINFNELINPAPLEIGATIAKEYNNALPLKYLYTFKDEKLKKDLVKLETVNGKNIYIDYSLLDYFLTKYIKISDLSFSAVNPKAPVYISDNTNKCLLGVIMPFNYKGEN